MRKEFLLPGDYVTTYGDAHFRTLLGSCVSICFSNRRASCFAMTHFMLPTNPGNGDVGRYGDSSTDKVLGTLLAMDPERSHYTARIYGGASIVSGEPSDQKSIGARNVALARRALKHFGIVVVDEHIGGSLGRRVDFLTDKDAVHCRMINDRGPQGTESEGPGSGVRVTIVDDSVTARKVIRAGIEAAGMLVVGEASNAFEAREVIVRRPPDVVTLDLEMPFLDGLSFLKKLMRYLPLPVVVVSSGAPSGSEQARKALEAGAHSVVDKADLDMSSQPGNVERVLVPRLRLAALAGLGRPRI